MCKSMIGKLIAASVAMTIAAGLLVGAFLRQWAAGAGGLMANPMQLAWIAAMYFAGFVFLGIAKYITYCNKDHLGKPEKRSRR